MVIDLGTGDGRAVLARAAAEPRALVIGLDAHAKSMAEASRRADRGRSALPNVLFLAAAVEALPGPLQGVASLVTVTMPWGSLLRGVLGVDAAALAGIVSIVAPGGRVEVLASVRPADGLDGLATLNENTRPAITDAWRQVGFELLEMRPATPADLAPSRSSWARRLGDRQVWCLVFGPAP